MAGGDLSDQTRIANVKARFNDKMLTAYESFLESQACLLDKRDPMLKKSYVIWSHGFGLCLVFKTWTYDLVTRVDVLCRHDMFDAFLFHLRNLHT